MRTETEQTPREIDEQLAKLYHEQYGLEDRMALVEADVKRLAGAEFYYRGRQRVTDMDIGEAEDILAADIEANADDTYGYAQVRGSTSIGNIRRTVEGLAASREKAAELANEIASLQAQYTGWSRFFAVTSSAGHVHSSMSCSTCYPRTRYGWLPELSGHAEAEAVEKLGPTLCTVCFPSAPVKWTEGKKLTKAQAAKAAA
ncbi:MAG: hypothetical protein LC798_12785 [Chloroflexi bacterium]|nr:hypothetical protein [Chloroflexota bacterium]